MESLDNDFRVVFEIDEKVLILLDSFELPVRTCEYKVEVEFCVRCELDFDILTDTVKINHHDFDSDCLHVFKSLNLIGFLLHADHKVVLLVVDNRTAVGNEGVLKFFGSLLFFFIV